MGGDGEGFGIMWMKIKLNASGVPEGNFIITHMEGVGGRGGSRKLKVCVGGGRGTDEHMLEMFESDLWEAIDVF